MIPTSDSDTESGTTVDDDDERTVTHDDEPNVDDDECNAADVLFGAARRAGCVAIDVAKEATYTVIGLGILGVQNAQVRRRELERALRR